MDQHAKIKRWQQAKLEKALKSRRVIYISGARQCGKTALAQDLITNKSNIEYVTLDDDVLLQTAKSDPNGFVAKKKKTLIIDEIQKAPELLSAIKMVVDQDNSPGQYVITGSVNIFAAPGANESLAGRMTYLRLRPFTQGEIQGVSPTYLDHFFESEFQEGDKAFNKQEILGLAFKGGFPEPQLLTKEERRSWFKDYFRSLLERDLKDISTIYRMDKMKKLMEVSASWSSKFLDVNAICSKLGIQRNTFENYFSALKSLFVVEDVPAWVNTDYERVGKKSKFYMSDCGLMTRYLQANISEEHLDPDQAGKIIETYVANQLMAYIDCTNDQYRLYHYRDREKREVDFIIERDDGTILGIEVKAGTALNEKSFSHLIWFRDHIAKGRKFIGIVLYTGHYVIKHKNGMYAVPMSNLWT